MLAPSRLKVDDALVRELTQDGLEQSGLTRTVGADQGGDLSAVQVERDPLQNGVHAHADGQILHFQAADIAAARAGAGQVMLFDAH